MGRTLRELLVDQIDPTVPATYKIYAPVELDEDARVVVYITDHRTNHKSRYIFRLVRDRRFEGHLENAKWWRKKTASVTNREDILLLDRIGIPLTTKQKEILKGGE